jgi:epoxyqueuosine reductase
VLRAKHKGFQRNVLIALGNSGDATAVDAVAEKLTDDEPLVRGHAVWALGRLAGAAAAPILEERKAVETDEWVLQEIAAAMTAPQSGGAG